MNGFEWFVVVSLVLIFIAVLSKKPGSVERGSDDVEYLGCLGQKPMSTGEWWAIHEANQLRSLNWELTKKNDELRRVIEHRELFSYHYKTVDFLGINEHKQAVILKKLGVKNPESAIKKAKKDIDWNAHDLGEFGKVVRTEYAKNIIEENFGGKCD